MRVLEAALGAIVWMAGFALAADTAEDQEGAKPQADGAIVQGLAIDSGFVIIRGEYLPSPYVVGTRGEELFINGRPIDAEQLQMRRWGFGGPYRDWQGGPWSGRPGGGSAGPATDPRDAERRRFNGAAHVEYQLQSGTMLIVFEDEMGVFLPSGSEVAVLDILLGSMPRDDKVRALMKLNTRWIESARWAEFVDAFKPSAKLTERIEKLKKERAVVYRPVSHAPNLSHSIKYSITVIGVVLGVVALGSLLNHRPKSHVPWHEIDTSGDSVPLVVRNVVLVVVLSFFDLGCTLLANKSLGFTEVNPLGSHLLDSPLLLAGFKVASLLLGCAILLALRRYRGAQVASWWLCLVCTILTFRWATYNSLFLS